MRRLVLATLAALSAMAAADTSFAQVGLTSDLSISWEVKNRFRLFRYESDFLKHVDADRGDGVLAAEQRLARATDGHGWARTMLNSLCVDQSGKLVEVCDRDGEKEIYLAPTDHRIGVLVPNAPAGASCAWTFDNGQDPAQAITVPCEEEVRLRVRYGQPTVATADIPLPDGSIKRATTEILVRDLLIGRGRRRTRLAAPVAAVTGATGTVVVAARGAEEAAEAEALVGERDRAVGIALA